MNPRPDDAGSGPTAPEPGADRDLAARIAAEPVADDDANLRDTFRGLAALLLDMVAARPNAESQGPIPPPLTPPSCPDVLRRPRQVAATAGATVQ